MKVSRTVHRWVWRTLLALLLMIGILSLAPSRSTADPRALTIGLIPEMNVFEQVDRFRPLAQYLSERIGRPVELTMLSRYGNIVERIENKEVDAAFLGSFTGALASAQLGMIPVARPINLDGSSTYWGYLFVRKDSGIEDVEQMRGRRLALVERATTAGFVFPVAFFKRNGIDVEDNFFSEVQFWGSHDACIKAVLEGRADVGAAKNTIWEHLGQENRRVDEELQILAVSPKVPSNGLLISSEVDTKLREKIKETLLGSGEDPAAKTVLEQLRFEGFVPTDTKSYNAVFELATEAGIDLTSYTYQNE